VEILNIYSIKQENIDTFISLAQIYSNEDVFDFEVKILDLLQKEKACFDWMFIAEENQKILGGLYFTTNEKSCPLSELHFADIFLPWESNYIEIGKEFFTQALSKVETPNLTVILCQLTNDKTSFFEQKVKLLENINFELFQEKCIYHKKDCVIPEYASRLNYKTIDEVGESEFIRTIEKTINESLDRCHITTGKRIGLKSIAPRMFNCLKETDFNPSWWLLAYDENSELVGVVIVQRLMEHLGTINYIGVIPEKRGKRYSEELLAKGTEILLINGIRTCDVQIDSVNFPLERALKQINYKEESRFFKFVRFMRRN
jgi:hypothetical protein